MTELAVSLNILPQFDSTGWNGLISRLPGAHFLQTDEWARVKAPVGWQALHLTWQAGEGPPLAAALVLKRSAMLVGLPAGASVLYSPRGPLLDWSDPDLRQRVLSDLQAVCRREKAIFLKIDPYVPAGLGVPGSPGEQPDARGLALAADLQTAGWLYSPDQIQFPNTVCVDLDVPEDEMLSRMKQKTRYNIRLAEKKGVQVRPAGTADLRSLYQMYAETSLRDGFVIREEAYYKRVWSEFIQAGLAEPLVASVDGQDVAGLVVMRFAGTAWYVYGMSRAVHREKMPNYLLQWQAMQRARAAGCRVYDLWGAPLTWNEADPLWNVYRFKEGLGGYVVRSPGAWDYPARPGLYRLYTRLIPRLLDLMRRRGRKRTAQEAGV